MTKEAASSENLFAGTLKNQETAPAETKTEAKPQTAAENPPEASSEASGEASGKSEEQLKAEHLARLKERATLMGIKFSNNIGIEALRERIEAKLNGETVKEPENQDSSETATTADAEAETAAEGKPKSKPVKSFRQELIEREMKLVRLRITNLDPKKKDLPGEIFTFANEVLGSVRKYIPYGEATDNGYHVPYCIYKQLRDREFVNIRTRKGPRGSITVESGMAREFSLEILPPLTEQEIARLAAQQAAAQGME